jgi:hypothetical protein
MELKASLERYRDRRIELINRTHELAQLRNKMSYLCTDQLSSAGASAIQSSRLTIQLNSEICEASNTVKELLRLVLADAKTVKCSILSLPPEFQAFSNEFMCRFVGDLEQQHNLEYSIADAIVNAESSAIDQDSLTTMMACFEYPPYLPEGRLDSVLAGLYC